MKSDDDSTSSTPYPLYGSTFTTFRISPLFNGKIPPLTSLAAHSKRLRDALSGDSFRGIQLATELSGASTDTTGPLMSCSWELLGDEASWERTHARASESDDELSSELVVNPQDACGIHVQLKFEKHNYRAILLGDSARKSAVPGFTNLPLLLTRMPLPLREALLDYLSTAFDSRISLFALRSRFLTSVLEAALEPTVLNSGPGMDVFTTGMQLQLAFPLSAPHMKSLDVSLSNADVAEFLRHGTSLWQMRSSAKQSSSNRHTNTPTPSRSPIAGPFTAALAKYLDCHLSLDFEHPTVSLAKASLGPYAFSSEGKVKILYPSTETRRIWQLLLEEAEAVRLIEKNDIIRLAAEKQTQDSDSLQPWAADRVPIEPPPPYELHDPALRDELG